MRALTLAFPLITLSACPGISDKDGDPGDYNGSGMPSPGEGEGEGEGDTSWWDTGAEGEGEGEGEGDPVFVATLSSSGVTLSIRGGSGSYLFGMAETSGDDQWTGEDCVYGYYAGDTYYQYCHSMGETGGNLPLAESLSELSYDTTLFSSALEGRVTYVALDSSYQCWTWGAEPSYYTSVGCTEQR